MPDYKKDFATLYKWIKQAREVILLIASTLAIIYTDDIKSFISSAGNKIWENPLTLVFLLLAIIAILLLIRRVIKFFQARKHVPSESDKKPSERLVKMYTSRSDINLEKVLDKVNKEYWSLAVTQHRSSLDVSEKIVKMIQAGKIVRLLLADPDPNKNNPTGKEPEFVKWCANKITAQNVPKEIENSLHDLHNRIYKELSPRERERFDVRLYNLPPLHTMIIIDQGEPDAWIQLESFGFKPDPTHAPLFIIEKAKYPETFAYLLASFNYVWDEKKNRLSKPVLWKDYESVP